MKAFQLIPAIAEYADLRPTRRKLLWEQKISF